jgi:3-oxoacyl-[acyl-carrier-protein] synthase II
MRRVVITGIGLLSAIGNGKKETWHNLLNGKSGIKKIDDFNTDEFPCKIAGYISNNQNNDNYIDITSHLDSREIKRNDRFIQYGIVAAKMAVEDAGIQNLS